ncbi:MAG: Tryptophan--tRNA ligase, mitochondrial [Candelina mexicana]|nr:MAG: Tryptophan--tRNA ligase, mitochondrial [Candelina mexicana]
MDLAPGSMFGLPCVLSSLQNTLTSVQEEDDLGPRLPRSVQAIYLKPLRRHAQYGVPACDLQLRSYSVRNVEFFADFALRAAYYLNLPAAGPVPLPRITERWTVPRSNFVHKKSQENFERITLRRLIQIQDGHPETVQVWLAFLKKHSYYGIGMKANIWEHEKLGVGRTMDVGLQNLQQVMEPGWARFGGIKNIDMSEKVMQMMISALRQWVALQNEAYPNDTLIYSIVDLHAHTVRQNPEQLQRWKRETLATLLAVGLDPVRSIIFYQSAVRAHLELMWILCQTTSTGSLNRMTQWKSKVSPSDDVSLNERVPTKLGLALYAYPVLQAADILVHRATHVPVGEDQVQHLEFARGSAVDFNKAHGAIFALPDIILSPAKRVMSLKEPETKMSKSHKDPMSRILLTDPPDQIAWKIRRARTDSLSGISYDPAQRAGVSNLIELMHYLEPGAPSCEAIGRDFEGLSMRVFKERVAECVVSNLSEFQDEYRRIMNADEGRFLHDVAMKGASRASAHAEETMTLVRKALILEDPAELRSSEKL